RLAVSVREGDNSDIWVWDLARNASARVTREPEDELMPCWSPDGRALAYARLVTGQGESGFMVSQVPADGSAKPVWYRTLWDNGWPEDWSSDGRRLLIGVGGFNVERAGKLQLFPTAPDGPPSRPRATGSWYRMLESPARLD